MLSEERRVRRRRKAAFRVGFLLLAFASATACIFDKGGDYKGGGRRGFGAEIVTAEPPPITDEEDPNLPPVTTPDSSLADVLPGPEP